MKINLQLFKGMVWYFIPQVLFWLFCGWFLFQHGEKDSFLLLNSFNSPNIDHPALWLTEISGGLILVSLFVIRYAKSRPAESLLGIIIVFIAWYTCITIKYNFYPHWKNPSALLKGYTVHLLGTDLQPEINFPSAHAVIVAALFTFLAWLFSYSKKCLIVLSVVAIILCLTRIYTGWAFLGDVLAGNLLGTVIALICIPWLAAKTERWYEKRNEWWRSMIIAIIRAAAICTIFVHLKDFIL